MKKQFFLSLFLLLQLLNTQDCDASPRMEKALQLQQIHVYLGKVRLLLTPNALRLDGLGKFPFTAIARAPGWQVIAIRPTERLYFTQKFEEFCDQGFFSNIVLTQRDDKMQPGGFKRQSKMSGFLIEKIQLPSRLLTYLKSTDYASPQAAAFLHSAYKVPTEGHIPISFELMMTGKDWMTNMSEEGQDRIVLNTQKISMETVSSSEFEIPKGLTKAKSMTRVIVGDSRKMEQTGVDALFKF